LASEYGQLDVVKLLLDKKAFINAKTKNGFTALHLACQNGHSRLVRFLIDRGADVDALTLSKKTSLHLAAEYGQLDVCGLLIKTVAHHLFDAVDNVIKYTFIRLLRGSLTVLSILSYKIC
jgi:ankyrin repeat protein